MTFKIKTETILFIVLCYLFSGQIYFKILGLFGKIGTSISVLMYGVLFFGGLISIFKVIKNINRFDFTLMLLLILQFGVSWLIEDNDEYFISVLLKLLLELYGFVAFKSIDDKKKLYELIRMASLGAVFLFLVFVIKKGNDLYVTKSYSMYYAYMIFPSVIVCLNETFRNRSILYGVASVIGMLVMFSFGTRGPVLLGVIYCVMACFIYAYSFLSKVIVIFLLMTASYIFVINPYVLEAFLSMIPGSSRIVSKMVLGALFTSDGRELIYETAIQLIKNNLITGVGLCRDRICIAESLGCASVMGYYPHNFFLELFLQYGVFVGSFFAFLIVYLISSVIYKVWGNEYDRSILMIFVFVGLAPLMISSSYVTYPYFFYMLGICSNYKNGRKNNLG